MDRVTKRLSREHLRGKPLGEDCKRARISTFEYGQNDHRCFCYGMFYEDGSLCLECRDCKAYALNAQPPKEEDYK